MSVKERREREEQARLDSILQAAADVFADKGYYECRMDDIAAAAELAKGTIYYYFKSKDEIYLHLLERETAKIMIEISRRVTEEATLLEALAGALEFYVNYFDENRSFLKMFLPCMCRFVKIEDESGLRKSARGYEKHGEFIRKALMEKIKRENLPLDGEALVRFLKTFQIGIGSKLLEGHKAEAESAARFFLDMMKRIVEGRT